MKTFFGILVCLSLLSCERISAPDESQGFTKPVLRMSEYLSPDSTFHVQNQTHANIGWVTLHLVDSTNAFINVPDSGTYSIHISSAPVSCLINGQILYDSIAAWITIDSHTRVHSEWTTNVIVVNQEEFN